ncbi:MAG: HAMP domain-containing sensor histidine kinase [Eubacteriales bacterium]|nr:HAMP domain-containing sensor histidine kinase [Eubacteriales bacterium]
MKLNKRIVIYSIILSGIIFFAFLSYNLFLLPGLYTDYRNNDLREKAAALHQDFVSQGNFDNLRMDHPTTTAGAVIDRHDQHIVLHHAYGHLNLTLDAPELIQWKDRLLTFVSDMVNGKEPEYKADDMSFKIPMQKMKDNVHGIRGLHAVRNQRPLPNEDTGRIEVKSLAGRNSFLLSAYHTEDTQYAIHLGVTITEDKVYCTYEAVAVATLSDIMPVLVKSLPMALSLTALIIWSASLLFSGSITRPVRRLARHTQSAAHATDTYEPSDISLRTDEIGDLSRDIDCLYKRLQTRYNRLADENERREMLLQATAHRLRTPVSGALLLTDGMTANVGKYKDRDRYLPVLRERLKAVSNIIEHMLRLEDKQTPEAVPVDLRSLLTPLLQLHADVQEVISVEGDGQFITDPDILGRILDNLITNAVRHGNPAGRIQIQLSDDVFSIRNTETQIPAEILRDITRPFVSREGDGHGMGLYLAAYDARRLNLVLTVRNVDGGVTVTLGKKA